MPLPKFEESSLPADNKIDDERHMSVETNSTTETEIQNHLNNGSKPIFTRIWDSVFNRNKNINSSEDTPQDINNGDFSHKQTPHHNTNDEKVGLKSTK